MTGDSTVSPLHSRVGDAVPGSHTPGSQTAGSHTPGSQTAGVPTSGLQVHGIRLRRLRLHGDDRPYDVDFRGPGDAPRPLSVIAGAFSTGKTTVLEFVDYCFGASDHPRLPEIMPKVRAATLEVELS